MLTDIIGLALIVIAIGAGIYTWGGKLISLLSKGASTGTPTPTDPTPGSIISKVFADAKLIAEYTAWHTLYDSCSKCPLAQAALVNTVLPAITTGRDAGTGVAASAAEPQKVVMDKLSYDRLMGMVGEQAVAEAEVVAVATGPKEAFEAKA